jgi:hypothetical protein
MKLVPWLLLLHLASITVACLFGLQTERDGTRLMAWGLALFISGWTSMLASAGYVVLRAMRKELSARDMVVACILGGIGLYEKNTGKFWVDHILSLPGWTWSP